MASSVNLGKALEAFIDEAVGSGRYGSRSEILREGVRLVQDREARLARFDGEMEKAFVRSQAEGGISVDEAFDHIEVELESMLAFKTAA